MRSQSTQRYSVRLGSDPKRAGRLAFSTMRPSSSGRDCAAAVVASAARLSAGCLSDAAGSFGRLQAVGDQYTSESGQESSQSVVHITSERLRPRKPRLGSYAASCGNAPGPTATVGRLSRQSARMVLVFGVACQDCQRSPQAAAIT